MLAKTDLTLFLCQEFLKSVYFDLQYCLYEKAAVNKPDENPWLQEAPNLQLEIE